MSPGVQFALLLGAFLALVIACVKPLGSYIASVMEG